MRLHRLAPFALLVSLAACTETVNIDLDDKGPPLPTKLNDAATALDRSDVDAANAALDTVVLQTKAAPEEYALSAFTYLMNVDQSCEEAATAMRRLRVTFDPSVDLFGENGFFSRAERDGTDAASQWLGDYLGDANQGSKFDEGLTTQDLVDAGVLLASCFDEMAGRLDRGFSTASTPRSLDVVLPAGLFYADEDVILEAPELKVLQGTFTLIASTLRMMDAFDWRDFPAFSAVEWFDSTRTPADPEDEYARLQEIVDRRNAAFFTVTRQDRLTAEGANVKRAFQLIQTGVQWAAVTDTDARGVLHMARLTPRAAELVGGYAGLIASATDGPAEVPEASGTVHFDLSRIFAGQVDRGDYEPYEIVDDDPTYVHIDMTAQFYPSMLNTLFDKRVMEVPGMLSEPTEVELFDYDTQPLKDAADVWDPLRAFLNRNWDGFWTSTWPD